MFGVFSLLTIARTTHEKCRSSAARARAGGDKPGRMCVSGKAVAVTRGNMLQNYKWSMKHTAARIQPGRLGWVGTKVFEGPRHVRSRCRGDLRMLDFGVYGQAMEEILRIVRVYLRRAFLGESDVGDDRGCPA